MATNYSTEMFAVLNDIECLVIKKLTVDFNLFYN